MAKVQTQNPFRGYRPLSGLFTFVETESGVQKSLTLTFCWYSFSKEWLYYISYYYRRSWVDTRSIKRLTKHIKLSRSGVFVVTSPMVIKGEKCLLLSDYTGWVVLYQTPLSRKATCLLLDRVLSTYWGGGWRRGSNVSIDQPSWNEGKGRRRVTTRVPVDSIFVWTTS